MKQEGKEGQEGIEKRMGEKSWEGGSKCEPTSKIPFTAFMGNLSFYPRFMGNSLSETDVHFTGQLPESQGPPVSHLAKTWGEREMRVTGTAGRVLGSPCQICRKVVTEK